MLSYEDLSAAQKRWVDLVEIHFPNILDVTNGTLTYKDILQIDNFFREKRSENKKYKVSKPIWLITNNAVERGKYKFPSSTFGEIIDENAPVASDMEVNYQNELKRLGIKPKK
jgi:hypothetical protein